MPLDNKDLFSAEFKEVGDAIRHFSTTRSALTTFLLTVGSGAFAAYFNKSQTSPFFVIAGFTFLTMAVVICFRFSWLTERYRKYQRELWKAAKDTNVTGAATTATTTATAVLPSGVRDYHPAFGEVWPKVCGDWVNWLLVAVVVILGGGFVLTAVGRDVSAGVPVAVGVVLVTLVAASVLLVWLRKLGAPFNLYVLLIPMWVVCAGVLVLMLWWAAAAPRAADPTVVTPTTHT